MSDPFSNLREQLALQEWPNVYLFKFIVPNESAIVAQTLALFGELSEIAFNESKTGKYVSISAKEVMMDADSIIEIYIRASEIKGVIAL